jgi:type IV secretory pathway TraG/TraD family ATPase VirD4
VGNLNSIDTLNAMGAGYGVQLISEFQDLNQLQTLKPSGWQTYLANAGLHAYLGAGIGDLFTSTHISSMSGTVDVPTVSHAMSDGRQGFQVASGLIDGVNRTLRNMAGNGPQVTVGARQRPYLLPEDVRECEGDEMYVFAEGVPGVIRAGRRPYYETPEFAGLYDEDPYHVKKH